MVLDVVVVALWAMLPAYIPNNAAVLAGGGRPIDGGTTLGGARVLGDGKTWRGAIAGIAAGAVLAQIMTTVVAPMSTLLGVSLPPFSTAAALALPTGAICGDIGASFIKRRTGRKRGAPFPGIDQLDFVVGALVLTALVAGDWFQSVFTLQVAGVVLLVTPVLHVLTNALAYWVGLKDEPW